MKTSEFIDVLSRNVEPARHVDLGKSLAIALALGLAVAFGVMLVVVGQRPDVLSTANLGYLGLKVGLALAVMTTSFVVLDRLAGPGGERLRLLPYLSILLVAILVGGGIALALLASPTRMAMPGMHPLVCILCIPLFAIVPFAAIIFVLRQSAPTDLRRAGAIAGLLAGGAGSAVYAFHCPDDSVLFVTAWYGAALTFCTFVGALVGPRLLRW